MTKILNSIALTGLSINKNHEEIIHSIVDILIREKREIFIEDILVKPFKKLNRFSSSRKEILKNCIY